MSSPRRWYDDKLWSTYITEAVQSGNATQYCTDKNIPYRTYKLKLADYNKSEDKENWLPSSKRRYRHRVFADSTEKADCLLSIHNDKNDVQKFLQVSDSTIARIKQQYKLNTVRAQRKSYNKSTVDDSVMSTFQHKLIDTLNYYNHKYVMYSDQTRIQQSMLPVYTIHQAGIPAVVNITWVSILIQIFVQHVL